MRTHVIFLFLLISTIMQAQKALSIEDDPYFECLKLHLKSLKDQKVLNDTVYVQQKDYLKDFTGRVNNVIIVMVDGKFIKEHTKRGKSLWVISINPVVFNEKNSSITIIDFGVSRRRDRYKMINNGGIKIRMEYDCDDGKYRYEVVASH